MQKMLTADVLGQSIQEEEERNGEFYYLKWPPQVEEAMEARILFVWPVPYLQ